MGKIKEPSKPLLFYAIMYADDKQAKKAVKLLVKKHGSILFESEDYPFTFSPFYEKEFGLNLKKRFILFERPIEREEIAKIKIYSNKLEDKFAKKENRTINLDPGYITPHNVILVSCKEFPHKVYLQKGIFGEVEMMFKKSGIEYPQHIHQDYKEPVAQKFFLEARREILKRQ